ncbi:hypothetical protein DICPUDRAFT_44673 [Dictyostelium purpureum]|uniref:Protein transport protein SEC23 n=1 Tax=Dictyostelium purpureum TaxID=5786 RepID=F0Z773_DICPU|nr:uncharacterized protein DICPUDRAFT_44673 [Dictyostelium purpureum]EGC40209.1 hypothetical protein DICPUDRAFT_44673 [Dictyostelium purpureum]|eukprot:XP_003283278.1 hypothetical protein DICPUDRAFT_44673 [Dictyostelium purpureum]
MNFESSEDRDGVRFSWNVWPTSRVEATKNLLVPLGCMYTPLHQSSETTQVPYPPLRCKGICNAILNPFCTIAPPYKTWVCPFCLQHNQFPPHYAGISDVNRPAELLPHITTIEYQLPTPETALPIYLFVVDVCLPDDELQSLTDSLTMSLSLIPENSYVGLITFGSMVQLYELGFTACPKSYVFRGNPSNSNFKISDLMQKVFFGSQETMNLQSKRFLVPVSECEFHLTSILEEIQKDPCRVASDKRPLRATGMAFSVANALLSTIAPNTGARIMAFIGGAATIGPGLIVSEELKEPIRSHQEIIKGKAKYTTKAYQFYKSIAERSVQHGHAIDIFSCSLDQIGLYEMREMVKMTGGYMVLADSFDHPMFQQSFQKIFKRDDGALKTGFNAEIQVCTSMGLKVCGAIGHMSSRNNKTPTVSENEIGIGGTSSWKVCALDQNSTFAFYFEISSQQNVSEHLGLVQFITSYQNSLGKQILRVTTVRREWAQAVQDPSQNITLLANGFDQETSAVLMARLAVFKAETEELPDITRWLDKMLIKLVSKYADYRRDDPNSFRLVQNFAIYPHFMFHLRRSNFLQVFNSSPDESSFYRFMLNRENVSNSLVMIQPTLEKYSFKGPPHPEVLSASSISNDSILLLDTFFHVLIFHGETIAQWRKAGYDKDPNHQNFRDLLQAPRDDAAHILKERFPYPRYIVCDQHSGEARFLLAIIDPNITHVSGNTTGGEVVFTDDVNLHVFLEHLKKFAVQS